LLISDASRGLFFAQRRRIGYGGTHNQQRESTHNSKGVGKFANPRVCDYDRCAWVKKISAVSNNAAYRGQHDPKDDQDYS